MFKFRLRLLAFVCVLPMAIAGGQQSNALDLTPPSKSFEEERQTALMQHQQVLDQFGGEYLDADLAAYVNEVGQHVAGNSDMPNRPFKFTVLNTPMVNAFTVGGGYVYVTRGILASINSEAELAALIAHEIGHVTGRHTSRRETRIRQDRNASVLLGLLTGSLATYGLSEIVGATLRQGYSRTQETEADTLSVETITRAGYDPYAMADMLGALKREVGLMQKMSGGTGLEIPAWLQDHPETDDRIRATTQHADRIGIERGTRTVNRDKHLDAIDGMIYGPDPALGIVRNGTFLHPVLKIAFGIPETYLVQNLPGALIAIRDETSMMLFTGSEWPAERSLEEFAISAWYSVTEGGAGGLDTVKPTKINGLPALIATKSLSGLFADATIATVVYRADEDVVFSLSFLVAGSLDSQTFDAFSTIANSFRMLSDEEAAAIKPLRLIVQDVRPGMTMDQYAAESAFKTFAKERLESLNGFVGEPTTGERIKLVTME